MHQPPHVYSIPPGAPFLSTLAEIVCNNSLYDDSIKSPLSLADLIIYLPTRRAVHSLRAILSNKIHSAILPQIRPLGDISDTELEGEEFTLLNQNPSDDSISNASRVLFLANAISVWQTKIKSLTPLLHGNDQYAIAGTASDIFFLAHELTRLLATFTIYDISYKDISNIIPFDQDKFWDTTRNFISIIAKLWPEYLEKIGSSDPMASLISNMNALADAIENGEINSKIIIAGSTGSMPSTAKLIRAVAKSKNGRIILPGLDNLADESIFDFKNFTQANYNHPQHILANLLHFIGIKRDNVTQIGFASKPIRMRHQVVSNALQPPGSPSLWHGHRIDHEKILCALRNCAYIEAADEASEAKAIACSIRETISDPAKRVAVITHDRQLAEQLAVNLHRWRIHFHDTADEQFARTESGALAIAIAEWMASPANPDTIMPMLSHPHAHFGLSKNELNHVIHGLDQIVFRSQATPQSIDEITRRISKIMNSDNNQNTAFRTQPHSDVTWRNAFELFSRLEKILKDNNLHATKSSLPLALQINLLMNTISFIVSEGKDTHNISDQYIEIQEILDKYQLTSADHLYIALADFPGILPVLMGTKKQPYTFANPGVTIYGLLESRLIEADQIILAGLNEQSWPPRPQIDMFLTRTMRAHLGLPPPERAIGQTAHDFVQSLLASENVVISRSMKKNGTPTIESRFVQRIAAYVGNESPAWKGMKERGQRYIQFANTLDEPDTISPFERPSPVPSPTLLPSRIAVTDAETLIRDPYAFFARKILRLEEQKPWNNFPEAAYRGQLIHELVARTATISADRHLEAWQSITRELFEKYNIPSDLQIFWNPALRQIGSWFAAWNDERAQTGVEILVEQSGQIDLALKNGKFIALSGRADRIERSTDGIAIIDFKTGAVPLRKSVESGLSPQLTLEAAMTEAGGFGERLKGLSVNELLYVALKGSANGSQEMKILNQGPGVIQDAARKQIIALRHRLDMHAEQKIGFISKRFPLASKRPSPYDHLARAAEWLRDTGEFSDE